MYLSNVTTKIVINIIINFIQFVLKHLSASEEFEPVRCEALINARGGLDLEPVEHPAETPAVKQDFFVQPRRVERIALQQSVAGMQIRYIQ